VTGVRKKLVKGFKMDDILGDLVGACIAVGTFLLVCFVAVPFLVDALIFVIKWIMGSL